MLQVHNLTAGYGPLTVLSGVSLSLADGARLGIFGHNGAGKTTLLRCIVGAVRPRDGKVDLDGADTGVATIAENVRRGIRSEEHTPELQSRFGISYAVFFLNN